MLRKQERSLVEQLLLGNQILLLNRLYVRGQRVFYFLDIVEATRVGGIQVLDLRSRGLEDARDLLLHAYLVPDSVDVRQYLIVLTLGQSQLLPEFLHFLHLLLLVFNQELAFGLPQVLVRFHSVVVLSGAAFVFHALVGSQSGGTLLRLHSAQVKLESF